ncbi:hypothetical protein PG987_000597 [Apiospora arundinis]
MALDRLTHIEFPKMNDKYKRLSGRRAEGTCHWLLDSDDFRDWKADLPKVENSKPRVLLLTGKPGCGKSVLMRAIVDHESQDASPEHVMVHFWFDGELSQENLSNSGAGFFQAMLYQLLARLDLDIEALMKLDQALCKTTERNLAASDVRKDIVETLRHMQPAGITIYLDGLDDCIVGSPSRAETIDVTAREQKTDILSVLEFLRDLPSQTGLGVKLCLSARSPTFLGDIVKPTYIVPVDKRNGDDIWTYLQGELKGEEMKKKPRMRQILLRLVQKQASNTFLWVRIVVNDINRNMISKSAEEILSLIESEPIDLFQLYESLLSHVGKNDRAMIQKEAEVLTHLVLVAARGLTLEEVGSILAFATGGKKKHESLESHIAKVSCGLVECQLDTSDPQNPRQVIRFIHESVATFVLKPETTLLSNPVCPKVAQAMFHFQAFQICSKAIQWKIDHESEEEPAMLPYAKQFWMHHARKGEAAMANDSAEEYEEFIKLCRWGSREAAGWYKESLISGRAAYVDLPVTDAPNGAFINHVDCLLVLLAFEGCTRLVNLHLQGMCDLCCGTDSDPVTALPIVRQAVFLAALRGYHETVRVLLDAADKAGFGAAAAINAHYEGKETALTAALFRDHKKVVDLLMERGANAELEDCRSGRYKLPLHMAVSENAAGMVENLLKRREQREHYRQKVKALLEQQDSKGNTALHIVFLEGAGDVLNKLLDHVRLAGVPVSPLLQQEDHEGFTALHLAVLKGAGDALKKLLKCAHDTSAPLSPLLQQEDHEGFTVLHIAVLKGAGDTLEKLLEYAHEVGVPLWPLLQQEDHEGSTALHLAVLKGAGDILEKLLECAKKADVPLAPLLRQPAGCGINPYRLCTTLKDNATEPVEVELFTHMIGIMDKYLPKGWEEDEGLGDC